MKEGLSWGGGGFWMLPVAILALGSGGGRAARMGLSAIVHTHNVLRSFGNEK